MSSLSVSDALKPIFATADDAVRIRESGGAPAVSRVLATMLTCAPLLRVRLPTLMTGASLIGVRVAPLKAAGTWWARSSATTRCLLTRRERAHAAVWP